MAFETENNLMTKREQFQPRCLTVRLPGVPVIGDFFATASGWVASEMVGIMQNALFAPVNIVGFAKQLLGIRGGPGLGIKPSRPRITDLYNVPVPLDGFEISMPAIFDVVRIGIAPVETPSERFLAEEIDRLNNAIEAEEDFGVRVDLIREREIKFELGATARRNREAAERTAQIEKILLSPSPESSRQRAAILTGVDNVQDDVATLAAALHVVKFLTGKAIPGIGQLSFIADALSLAQAGARATPRNLRLGRKGKGAIKKEIKRVSESKFGTQTNRIETANRAGKLGIGMADIVQGLQSLEQHTGYGLRLGALFSAVTDLYYGFLRGGKVTFAGPSWDPFNFARKSCTRSPSLSDIATGAEAVCTLSALRIWSDGSRLLECTDCLTPLARKRVLWGLVHAMECLYPWLVGQDWESTLTNFANEPVVGIFPRDSRSEDVWNVFAPKEEWRSAHLVGDPDREISMEEWVKEGSSRVGSLLLENINLVEDPFERDLLETALVGSSWSLLAGLNPAAPIDEVRFDPSTLEDLRAFDGQPEASERLGRLLDVRVPAETG